MPPKRAKCESCLPKGQGVFLSRTLRTDLKPTLTVGLTFFHRCLDTVSTTTITDGSFGSNGAKLI